MTINELKKLKPFDLHTQTLLYYQIIVYKKGALKRHIECVHEGSKPYACDLCDKAYTQSQALVEHKVKVHKLLPYKCSLCPEGYPQRKDLIDHLGVDFVFLSYLNPLTFSLTRETNSSKN